MKEREVIPLKFSIYICVFEDVSTVELPLMVTSQKLPSSYNSQFSVSTKCRYTIYLLPPHSTSIHCYSISDCCREVALYCNSPLLQRTLIFLVSFHFLGPNIKLHSFAYSRFQVLWGPQHTGLILRRAMAVCDVKFAIKF